MPSFDPGIDKDLLLWLAAVVVMLVAVLIVAAAIMLKDPQRRHWEGVNLKAVPKKVLKFLAWAVPVVVIAALGHYRFGWDDKVIIIGLLSVLGIRRLLTIKPRN